MPGGNGTGPDGRGGMTGRGAGFCAGTGMPGYMNQAGGRGAGAGFGRRGGFFGGRGGAFGAGRGRRFGFSALGQPAAAGFAGNSGIPYQNTGPEFTKQALQNQAESLKAELELINQRIQELEEDRNPE